MTFFNKIKVGIFDSENDSLNTGKDKLNTLLQVFERTAASSANASLILDNEQLVFSHNTAWSVFLDSHKAHLSKYFQQLSVTKGREASELIKKSVSLNNTNSSHLVDLGEYKLELHATPIKQGDQILAGWIVEAHIKQDFQQKQAILNAIDRSQAFIEFTPEGIITRANDNFIAACGYELSEIVGQHHKIFVPKDIRDSHEYQQFWQRLGQGEFITDEVKRINKKGETLWLSATYNPVFDDAGKVINVVKFASDITQQKLETNDYIEQIRAIHKSQAVIEFNMDGTIRVANDAFLATAGYTMAEIEGKHHRIFMTPEDAASPEYAELWQKLNKGIFVSDEIKRVDKQGNIVWLQASYNPLFDDEGRPYKVVKYASNVSDKKNATLAINKTLLSLAQGDLTATVDHFDDTDLNLVGEAINSFVSKLSGIMNDLLHASDTIKAGSQEITQGNTALSGRTERQAANIEETASSMEELTSTVKLNSENANHANKLANDASKVASSGGELINEVVDTMSSITESSRKISEIIGVIDGIAFQTNILALNAAVEAARAGEQGRGFAVVASEVRTLAQRSANAAKDIKELISDSVSKIENGNELVNQSGKTMSDIVSSIEEVNTIMAKIDQASTEQASGIAEVTLAIKDMDGMTQQNAALVEEAAASSESMQSQASQLAQIVATFKTKA